MPLRSPKMYSFIFGFQRRVWWPKWTPASSSSFMGKVSTVTSLRLALRPLEALARPLLAVLLAFLHPGIAGQKTVLAQLRTQRRIGQRQRPRQPLADGARLAVAAAALDGNVGIELVGNAGEDQRPAGMFAPGRAGENFFQRAAVHAQLPAAGTEVDTRHRGLAPAGAVRLLHPGRLRTGSRPGGWPRLGGCRYVRCLRSFFDSLLWSLLRLRFW